MATLDMVNHYGGKPANFCDVGGGADAEHVATALQIIQGDQKVHKIFINILAGITRCDEVAKGIVEVKKVVGLKKPLVVRMQGTNFDEGKRILDSAGITTLEKMDEAAQLVTSAKVALVGKQTRAIVQGITGNQGSFHTRLMREYGTQIVAGVTPGKGGTSTQGVSVYDTVAAALERTDANASIIFVPAPFAKEAGMEAIDAGLNPVVIITEMIPARDSMVLMAYAKEHGATIIGPNTPGVITPGEAKLGIMPGDVFSPGGVGVASRSGTLTYEIASYLTRAGIGQSTCLGIGGDPITGLNFVDVLKMFRDDKSTDAVVLIGEIGGSAEEDAADFIEDTKYAKPVAAYVAGRAAPPGKRMGHAGAIITGTEGTADAKMKRFREVGVRVAEVPSELPRLLQQQKAATIQQ